MLNAHFWSDYFERTYIPSLEHLFRTLETRLLANFRPTDIENEAEAVRDEAWECFMSSPVPKRDPEDCAQAAQEAGLRHYMMLSDIRQGVINMFAAGLYHAFEQQLVDFYRCELMPRGSCDPSLYKVSRVKGSLRMQGVDIELLESWKLIDELRLLANTVKHGEGGSAAELRRRRPDLFNRSDMPPEMQAFFSNTQVFLPMLGEDLYVTTDQLRQYRDATVEFWRQLSRALSQLKNT